MLRARHFVSGRAAMAAGLLTLVLFSIVLFGNAPMAEMWWISLLLGCVAFFFFLAFLIQFRFLGAAEGSAPVTFFRSFRGAAVGIIGLTLPLLLFALLRPEALAGLGIVLVLGWLVLAVLGYMALRIPVPSSALGGLGVFAEGLAVAAVVGGIAVWAWSYNKITAAQPVWAAAITAERARVSARPPQPVVEGEAIAANAPDVYWSILNLNKPDRVTADLKLDWQGLGRTAAAGPWPTLSTDPKRASQDDKDQAAGRAILDKYRANVAALRDALRRTGRDWKWALEKGDEMELPSLFEGRVLNNLLILEGHEKARAKDVHAAAVRYLEAIRFGSDLGDEPVAIVYLIGVAYANLGLDSLGRLVTEYPEPNPELPWIEASLEKLAVALPKPEAGFREGVVTGVELSKPGLRTGGGDALVGFFLLPWRASALDIIPSLFERSTRAASLEDTAEANRQLQALGLEAGISFNPVVSARMPSLMRLHIPCIEMRARISALLSAIRVEKSRAKDGRYPTELAALVGVDPFAKPGTKLRFAADADGRGYKIWSIGMDHKDDGGTATNQIDIVLQRGAHATP